MGAAVTWLPGVLLGVVLAVVSWVVSGARRAQRQDTDGRVLDDTARATQRHVVTVASLSQSIESLASVVGKMDAKLDRALGDINAAKVEHAAAAARAENDRDRLARIEADHVSLRAEIRRVDESHTTARHALRTEIQGWVTAGVADAIGILRTLVDSHGGGDARARPTRRGS
jgi:hypothetical protein